MAENNTIMFPMREPAPGFFTFNARIVPRDARRIPLAFFFVRGSLRNDAARMTVKRGPVDWRILLIGAEVYTIPMFWRLMGIATPNNPRSKNIPIWG